MKGFIYRTGIRLKELGERKNWIWAYRIGVWLKDKA